MVKSLYIVLPMSILYYAFVILISPFIVAENLKVGVAQMVGVFICSLNT